MEKQSTKTQKNFDENEWRSNQQQPKKNFYFLIKKKLFFLFFFFILNLRQSSANFRGQ